MCRVFDYCISFVACQYFSVIFCKLLHFFVIHEKLCQLETKLILPYGSRLFHIIAMMSTPFLQICATFPKIM